VCWPSRPLQFRTPPPLAETIIGLHKTEVIRQRGPWRGIEAVEFATLEWVDWFNHRRLLEPIGNVPRAEKELEYYQNLESAEGGLTQTTEPPVIPGRFRQCQSEFFSLYCHHYGHYDDAVRTSSLGELELLVLLACLRLGDDAAYAVSIADEIERRVGRKLHRATIYVTLQRLESRAFVATRLSEPRAERGGKARRIVSVTPAGRAAVLQLRNSLQRMWAGLGPVLESQ
jgi:DNA-binding PadR family transcriptional regulator